jgi:hypothetical protein
MSSSSRRDRRIPVADEQDHLAVGLDGDALGDEILLHHFAQRLAFGVLACCARSIPAGLKSGDPPS